MTYSYIDTDQKMAEMRNTFEANKTGVLAVDFEGEFNLHRYGERLCLIQIFDGADSYIVDPFTVSRDEITAFLKSDIVKLFYGAGSDVKLAHAEYGIRIASVLDLQLIVGVLDLPKKSLGAVLEALLDIRIENKSRYQRYNWTLRPIDSGALEYALSDVRHLYDLHTVLLERVQAEGLVREMTYRLSRELFDFDKPRIPGIKKKGRYRDMKRAEKTAFDAIYDSREASAKELDLPPNSVLSNDQLFQVVEGERRIQDLYFGKQVPAAIRDRISGDVDDAIRALPGR